MEFSQDEGDGPGSLKGEKQDSRLKVRVNAEFLDDSLNCLQLGEPICVDSDAILSAVIEGMAERNHGCVLVHEGEQLVGIFTERDIVRRVLIKGHRLEETRIEDVMTRNPQSVSCQDTLETARNKMTLGGFRHLPIVDIKHRPLGVVSVKDILHYIVQPDPTQTSL